MQLGSVHLVVRAMKRNKLQNVELIGQWIRFFNRRDWLATKHLVLCELHFEEKYLQHGEKYCSGR